MSKAPSQQSIIYAELSFSAPASEYPLPEKSSSAVYAELSFSKAAANFKMEVPQRLSGEYFRQHLLIGFCYKYGFYTAPH